MASAYITQYRILRSEWCYKKILCPVGIISSDGAWPCFLLYSFLLHSFILSPLQYWLMNPLQAKSLTSPYFLKKPHVVSFSHSWSIYHSLFHAAIHIYKPNSAHSIRLTRIFQTSPYIRLKISFDSCIQTFMKVCFHINVIVLHFTQGQLIYSML